MSVLGVAVEHPIELLWNSVRLRPELTVNLPNAFLTMMLPLVCCHSGLVETWAGPPYRWVGIARQDCEYEPEPTIAASMTLTLLTYH